MHRLCIHHHHHLALPPTPHFRLFSGKKPPTLFVLDTEHWAVQQVQGLPEDASCGQPVWSPQGEPTDRSDLAIRPAGPRDLPLRTWGCLMPCPNSPAPLLSPSQHAHRACVLPPGAAPAGDALLFVCWEHQSELASASFPQRLGESD